MIPSHSAIPIGSLRKITRTLHDSISRVATGLRVLGGIDASSQSMANSLTAKGEVSRLQLIILMRVLHYAIVESALLELNNHYKAKEVGIAKCNQLILHLIPQL